MIELDIAKLKRELIKIYYVYLRNPNDQKMKSDAFRIYMTFFSASVLLDDATSKAFYGLVDIGADTGAPKPTKAQVKKMLQALQEP
ncbi:hypothetical protein KY329_01475 [Candidatus Woesearchaeota archaeon]|nr:hypothetical protein [Candidatus Woesearchaeota archaeon]